MSIPVLAPAFVAALFGDRVQRFSGEVQNVCRGGVVVQPDDAVLGGRSIRIATITTYC